MSNTDPLANIARLGRASAAARTRLLDAVEQALHSEQASETALARASGLSRDLIRRLHGKPRRDR